jgi:hypothetical protein
MTKWTPATATMGELTTRISAYETKVACMIREDDDSPTADRQIANLRACIAGLRAEIARRNV